jgi:hypothetical protein
MWSKRSLIMPLIAIVTLSMVSYLQYDDGFGVKSRHQF